MNKAILMGRLTADPELRQTQNGTAVCRFTVAVNRRTQDKSADFISCTAWGKTADFIAKYFTKGQVIAVNGELRTGSYQDKKHPDITHYMAEVWVETAEFTGSKVQNGMADYAVFHVDL